LPEEEQANDAVERGQQQQEERPQHITNTAGKLANNLDGIPSKTEDSRPTKTDGHSLSVNDSS
jgi:hypothetical protein